MRAHTHTHSRRWEWKGKFDKGTYVDTQTERERERERLLDRGNVSGLWTSKGEWTEKRELLHVTKADPSLVLATAGFNKTHQAVQCWRPQTTHKNATSHILYYSPLLSSTKLKHLLIWPFVRGVSASKTGLRLRVFNRAVGDELSGGSRLLAFPDSPPAERHKRGSGWI